MTFSLSVARSIRLRCERRSVVLSDFSFLCLYRILSDLSGLSDLSALEAVCAILVTR